MEMAERPTVSLQVSELWITDGRRIYRYLYRLTGDRELAADLTQEVFVRAIRAGAEFQELTAPWLFRVATNLANDHFRRQRLLRWLPFRVERHGGVTPDSAESLAEQDLVRRSLDRLSRDAASLVLLKNGEGFSTREIADLLGENYEAVRKRLARAQDQFRIEYIRLKGVEV